MAPQLPSGHKIVHLELKTGNLGRACSFYGGLLGWRPERVTAGGLSYLALELGAELGGGVVEDERESALWLPYVEVEDVRSTTEEAVARGAGVQLDVREGPGGWRSVVETPDGAEIAFWQRKR
jgi:predicted enzyme related to lactoylglutathione lyase